MAYVDGYLIPIPRKNVRAYKKMAALGCKVWMHHGALAYHECVGEELAPKWGVAFTKLLKAKPSETVVFAWIVFKSKAHRNKVNAAVMKDIRMSSMSVKKMPFDPKKMCYGGFKTLVSG